MPVLSSNPSSVVSAGTWTTATNVYTSDNTYATNTGATQNTEYPMDVGGFNFAAFPASGVINTVTVTIEAKASNASRAQIRAELYDGSTLLSGSLALVTLGTTDTNYTFTPTVTLAQLQSANLKVRVINKRTASQAATTSVDYVKIDVNYVVKAETFTDDFATQVDKTTKWPASSVQVVWDSSGQAKIPCTSGYYALQTTQGDGGYDFIGSYLMAKVTPPPIAATRETMMQVYRKGVTTDSLAIFVSGSNIQARQIVNSVPTQNTAVPYSATNHAWWRIRESGGTIYFDTSPDSLTWSNFWSIASGWNVANCWFNFVSGWYTTDPGAADAYIDNVNLPYPSITQAAYRFYADGTEAGSTALAAQGTAPSVDLGSGDVNLQLRMRLQSTTAVNLSTTDDWQLQWEKNASGVWANVDGAWVLALIDGYDESNQNGITYAQPTTQGAAQSFRGDGRALSSAGFQLRKTGAPDHIIGAALYAHTGTYGTSSGKPTGSPLETSSTTLDAGAGDITSTAAWYDFTFAGTSILTNGTPYCVALTFTNQTVSNALEIGVDTTSTYAGSASTFFSGAWNAMAANTDFVFRVQTLLPPAVVPYDSPGLDNLASTTNRLTGGTGTFQAGEISETGLVTDLGWSGNNHTELLYSITLKATGLANGDTLRFRVLYNGAATQMTYTQVPTVSITTGPVVPNGAASITGTGTVVATGGGAKVTGAAAVTATSTITVAGVAKVAGAAVITAIGTIDASGQATFAPGTADVSGVATITVTGAKPSIGPVLLNGPNDSVTVNPGGTQSTSVTVNSKPANLADGDLLLAVVVSQALLQTGGMDLTCDSAEWKRVGPVCQTGATGKRPSGMWVMPVPTASTVTTTGWTWRNPYATSRWVVRIYRVTGADLSTWLDVAGPWSGPAGSGGSTYADFASVTTATAADLVVYHIHSNNTAAQGNAVITAPAEVTLRDRVDNVASGTASNDSLVLYEEARPSIGATGTRSFTTPTQSAFAGFQIALKPVAVAAPTGYPKVWTGSAWSKKPAKVWTGSAWVQKPMKVWTGSTWKTLT